MYAQLLSIWQDDECETRNSELCDVSTDEYGCLHIHYLQGDRKGSTRTTTHVEGVRKIPVKNLANAVLWVDVAVRTRNSTYVFRKYCPYKDPYAQLVYDESWAQWPNRLNNLQYV